MVSVAEQKTVEQRLGHGMARCLMLILSLLDHWSFWASHKTATLTCGGLIDRQTGRQKDKGLSRRSLAAASSVAPHVKPLRALDMRSSPRVDCYIGWVQRDTSYPSSVGCRLVALSENISPIRSLLEKGWSFSQICAWTAAASSPIFLLSVPPDASPARECLTRFGNPSPRVKDNCKLF